MLLAGQLTGGGGTAAGERAEHRHLGGAQRLVDALVLEASAQQHHGGTKGAHGGGTVAVVDQVRHVH